MTTLNRRRSWLFSPATKPDRFDRAASAGADVLTPSAEAVAEAQRILEENAKGVGVVGGRMVDEAVHARQVAFLPPPAHWFLSERRMRGLNASKPML
jgi:citrate lyase beta subunit